MKKLVFFSGAGISAESGLKTFRDSNGLWENYRVEDVATPEAFARDPQRGLNFYNARRAQLKEVRPNAAHFAIAELEKYFEVNVITQNVDDLHERAGSTAVLHLHGELRKARPTGKKGGITPWEGDINLGDVDAEGIQFRPHIVWFGETVDDMETAVALAEVADIFVIIGTSLQVYPAAGLVNYVQPHCKIFCIDPDAGNHLPAGAHFIRKTATEGMTELMALLTNF